MPDEKETKFEQDLATFFPDIYRVHQAGKFDKYLWEAVYSMLSMMGNNAYGEVKVVYQNGKINQILVTESKVSAYCRTIQKRPIDNH